MPVLIQRFTTGLRVRVYAGLSMLIYRLAVVICETVARVLRFDWRLFMVESVSLFAMVLLGICVCVMIWGLS